MKLALIGYGKMGQTIERIAKERGHEIVAIIDLNNQADFESEAFKSAEVAIEFTAPAVAMDNYKKCFAAGVKVVSGTTGWLDQVEVVKEACANQGQTFFYSSNYSIGVNIFFALNKYLAKIMNKFENYNVNVAETHHIHKLDAPSGTAITLAEDIIHEIDRKKRWSLGKQDQESDLQINAFREGEVPGIHEIKYNSPVDYITIKHSAYSREGFALGAVLAAEYTASHTGFLSMSDLLKF